MHPDHRSGFRRSPIRHHAISDDSSHLLRRGLRGGYRRFLRDAEDHPPAAARGDPYDVYNTVRLAPRLSERSFVAVLMGALVAAASAWGFYYRMKTGSRRTAHRLVKDGSRKSRGCRISTSTTHEDARAVQKNPPAGGRQLDLHILQRHEPRGGSGNSMMNGNNTLLVF